MPRWEASTPVVQRPVRRVRDEVKDGVAVVLISVAASTVMAVCVLLLTELAG